MKAKLRVCASCEWIFSGGVGCPKCQFGSYGARYVYGNKAYRYAISQKPWLEKKMSDYAFKLHQEINASKPKQRSRLIAAGLYIKEL
ncbi:hypothetical protein VRC60_05860 [Erwinia sp. E_sp_B04_7]|uniref:hypothetical protein n=1 Tax=unclassified Erwinia TaxID=2622719 RepID=UPI0030CFAC9C